MSLAQINKSAEASIATNIKQKQKEDILAFSDLLYDIFKEKQANANLNDDQNSKVYTVEEE